MVVKHQDAWTPIDNDEIQAVARSSIRDITNELRAMKPSSLSASDICEHALLYAYLGLEAPSESWNEWSLEYLNLAVDCLARTTTTRRGQYGGLAGIGWMIQHTFSILSAGQNSSLGWNDDDALSEIDAHLLGPLTFENSLGLEYDLISGYVGLGVYWLERLPRKAAVRGIRQTLDALERVAEKCPDFVTWFTTPAMVPPQQRETAPLGYHNLGVAHGVPGVIAFLAQIATLGLEKELTDKAHGLLAGAMKWLLAQRRHAPCVSCFSSWISTGTPSGDSRLGWCYGDLGIAGVLWFVARRTENPHWMREAQSLSDHCVSRQPIVADCSLCHGALGVAHIYNRIFQSTRAQMYQTVVLDWANKGLALREHGIGIAGYYYDNPPYKSKDASFLTGAVGIALALLSLAAPIEPRWDRRMLLSGAELSTHMPSILER